MTLKKMSIIHQKRATSRKDWVGPGVDSVYSSAGLGTERMHSKLILYLPSRLLLSAS